MKDKGWRIDCVGTISMSDRVQYLLVKIVSQVIASGTICVYT
jgi:hypothetical protein